MRRALPISVFIAGIALGGCFKGEQKFKFVRPAMRIQSVVSLSPSTTEIISTYGNQQWIKGRTASDDYPPQIAKVPIVCSLKPDYEKITAIHPDLILYDKDLYNAADIQKIKSLGFTTWELNAENIADFEKQLYQLGDLVQQQTNVNDYVTHIEEARSEATSHKTNPPVKVAVIIVGSSGSDLIAGTKSFVGDVIRSAGGELVGPDTGNFGPLNAETLVSENPDLIFVPTTAPGTPADSKKVEQAAKDVDQILHDPKLQAVSAVKNHHIQAIDQDVVLRRGVRVDKFIGNAYEAIGAVGGAK